MAGLELLYNSILGQVRGHSDAVVCCLHWAIIRKDLKCIGVGEQAPQDVGGARRSEMLPTGWNDSPGVYTLLYTTRDGKHVYVLKIIQMDNTLLVHFMRLSDECVSDMTVDVTQYTSNDLSSFESALQNVEELEKQFNKEVLEVVLQGSRSSRSQSTDQSPSSRQRQDPLGEEDPLRVPPRHPQRAVPPEWADPGDPFAIGRGDLDPIAGGMGGGMIFDPMRSGGYPARGIDPSQGLPGRLPRGAVPPGARFDPFGPPDLDRSGNPRGGRGGRAGPNPDHLPPPGFDDMFM